MQATFSALRRPVRYLKKQFTKSTEIQPAPAPSILDAYCRTAPNPQTTLDIFRGEWASQLPSSLNLHTGGIVPLFEDDRIAEGIAALGGVTGQSVLELGPLEGGHSYMLERAGADAIVAIESNSRAYLKCLITKELFGLNKVRFLLGDFMEYLRQQQPHFDMVLASGVLYHQRDPVELIYHLAQTTNRVLVWTHYYEGEVIQASPLLAPKFPGSTASEFKGFRHTLYRQEYQASLAHPGYCGGSADYSCWLPREELLQAFRYFGFTRLTILREDRQFPNGPCILLTAQKS